MCLTRARALYRRLGEACSRPRLSATATLRTDGCPSRSCNVSMSQADDDEAARRALLLLQAELDQTRSALAEAEDKLALSQAQVVGLHAVTQALQAEKLEHGRAVEESAAMARADAEARCGERMAEMQRAFEADLEVATREALGARAARRDGDGALERSPDSVWDARRLGLRPLRGAAAARLNEQEQRRARRRWHRNADLGTRQRFGPGHEQHSSSSSSDEERRNSIWRTDGRAFQDDAARRIQIGLRRHIARRVIRAGFIRAYMTLFQVSHNRLPRVVLVHCTKFAIGPHAHGES